ncbi:MAG TPA: menaquinone biosynthesis protein [Vicinamibacterales bacterium]|nr:menaquinone biosynthesis protein [Vicinamibacterales bacterium]
MTPTRLGAVHYLNVRPLVYGLERDARFSLRFDAPSRCASLLALGEIDLGMIPSIEYARAADYRIVPGLSISSCGEVASVALFSPVPVERVRTVAADTSSRTSVALLQVLCARRFCIAPEFRPMPPSPHEMLAACDAALIIGDPALFLDHAALGVQKIDLGAEWLALTGLPFVWAFWAGRACAADRDLVARLQRARDEGVDRPDEIATAYSGGDAARASVGARYLKDNMRYGLGEPERAAIARYYREAAALGLAPAVAPAFYDA